METLTWATQPVPHSTVHTATLDGQEVAKVHQSESSFWVQGLGKAVSAEVFQVVVYTPRGAATATCYDWSGVEQFIALKLRS